MVKRNLFAYGTLMFPEVAVPLAGITQWGQPAVLHGFRRRKVQLRSRGNFPAIIRQEGATVTGILYRGLQQRQVDVLDWFEQVYNQSYTQETVVIQCDAESVEAIVYVCGQRLADRLDGDWRPEQFQRKELDWYIENAVRHSVETEWHQIHGPSTWAD